MLKRPRFYNTLQCAWHLICKNYFLWYFCYKIYRRSTFGWKAVIEMNDLVFNIGPFFWVLGIIKNDGLKSHTTLLFWSRRFWKFWRLELTLNPHLALGPHFGTAQLIEPFLTHSRLTPFCKVFCLHIWNKCFCQLKRPFTI